MGFLPMLATDPEAAKDYNYFRDYDSSLGRYQQSDPIGLKGGPNTYSYVGARPLVLKDPKGLEPGRKATCYWWDRPDSPYDHVFGGSRRYGPPLVTMPWPGPGDPTPDYTPDIYGEMQPTCLYWWRPPRRCELQCKAVSAVVCTALFPGAGAASIGGGFACDEIFSSQCEKSCGDRPPCTGNDFSYGAP